MTLALQIQCKSFGDAERVITALRLPAELAPIRPELDQEGDRFPCAGAPPVLQIQCNTIEDAERVRAALERTAEPAIAEWVEEGEEYARH